MYNRAGDRFQPLFFEYNAMTDSSYIIEFYRVGNLVKVSAIDPETAKEATIIAPTSLSRKEMSDLAVRKLRYVLAKKNDG